MEISTFHLRELRTPLAVAALLTIVAIGSRDALALVGLPLVFLGWCAAAPNFNLGDGFLPLLGMLVGVVLGFAFAKTGLTAAGLASGGSWILASIEAAIRARPEKVDV